MKDIRRKSSDAGVEQFLPVAYRERIDLIWDRYEAQQPLCGFGETGLHCIACLLGPCRIDPYGEGTQVGTCGLCRNEMVALNFLNIISRGAEMRIKSASAIAGEGKSSRTAFAKLADGKSALIELLPKLASNLKKDSKKPVTYSLSTSKELIDSASYAGIKALNASAVLISSIDTITRLSCFKFDTNIGALKLDAVNVLIAGEISIALAKALISEAKISKKSAIESGARQGVFISSMAGTEHLCRLGIPIITNVISQEVPLLTNAIEALVVGGGCCYPSLNSLCSKLHTTLYLVGRSNEDVQNRAHAIIDGAIANFRNRRQSAVNIPDVKEKMVYGILSGDINLIALKISEGISSGKIRGLAHIGGCGNVRQTHDLNEKNLAIELLRKDVLCITTGCAGTALGKAGLLNAEKVNEFCGDGLSEYIQKNALPPVICLGSCLATARAMKLIDSVNTDKVVSAYTGVSTANTAADAIGVAGLGIPTFIGEHLPVWGSKEAVNQLSERGVIVHPRALDGKEIAKLLLERIL